MLKNVLKKSAIYFISLVSGKLLTAVFFIFLARILLPQKFGEITYFITLVQLITALADLGLKQFFQKKMAIDAHNWLFTQILGLRLLSFLISVFIIAIIRFFAPATIPSFGWLIICLLIEALMTVADAYYLSIGKSIRLGQKLIARNVLLFSYFVAIFVVGAKEMTMATGQSISLNLTEIFYAFSHGVIQGFNPFYFFYTLSVFLVLLIYFPYKALKFSNLHFNWRKIKHLLSRTYTYAIMDGCSVAYSKADGVVMNNTLGAAALGVYGSAYRFLESFNLLPQALFHNLFSISAKKNGLNWRQLKSLILTMGGVGALIGLGLAIISEPLIYWTMGPAYMEAVPVLRIFGIVNFLFFLNSPLNIVIQSSDKIRKFLPWVVGNVLINIGLNLLFLKMTGSIITAAWVMVICEVISIGVNGRFVLREKLISKI